MLVHWIRVALYLALTSWKISLELGLLFGSFSIILLIKFNKSFEYLSWLYLGGNSFKSVNISPFWFTPGSGNLGAVKKHNS